MVKIMFFADKFSEEDIKAAVRGTEIIASIEQKSIDLPCIIEVWGLEEDKKEVDTICKTLSSKLKLSRNDIERKISRYIPQA